MSLLVLALLLFALCVQRLSKHPRSQQQNQNDLHACELSSLNALPVPRLLQVLNVGRNVCNVWFRFVVVGIFVRHHRGSGTSRFATICPLCFTGFHWASDYAFFVRRHRVFGTPCSMLQSSRAMFSQLGPRWFQDGSEMTPRGPIRP